MKIPPEYSVVAYWVEPKEYDIHGYRDWDSVQHYVLLDSVAPASKIYHALKLYRTGGYASVRIQLEVAGSGMLVTEKEYNKLYEEAVKARDQHIMWRVLSS